MNRGEFLNLLDELLEEDQGTLTGSELLVDLEMWDSMTVLGFVALLDEQFRMQVDSQRIIDAETVNDLIALVGEHIIG